VARFLYAVVVVLAFSATAASTARAQRLATDIHLPDKPKPAPKLHFTAAWLTLSFAGQMAAYADVQTTVNLRDEAPGFQDSDPIARPFVNLPTPEYVAFATVLTAGISEVSRKMHGSSNKWVRRLWWVPQTVQIATNSACAAHNAGQLGPVSVARKRK
jgi:hypothetical protein